MATQRFRIARKSLRVSIEFRLTEIEMTLFAPILFINGPSFAWASDIAFAGRRRFDPSTLAVSTLDSFLRNGEAQFSLSRSMSFHRLRVASSFRRILSRVHDLTDGRHFSTDGLRSQSRYGEKDAVGCKATSSNITALGFPVLTMQIDQLLNRCSKPKPQERGHLRLFGLVAPTFAAAMKVF